MSHPEPFKKSKKKTLIESFHTRYNKTVHFTEIVASSLNLKNGIFLWFSLFDQLIKRLKCKDFLLRAISFKSMTFYFQVYPSKFNSRKKTVKSINLNNQV